jgi:phenylpropionate dioxygenase-like ring-hydroxylating dioxygenase large terminal subunit
MNQVRDLVMMNQNVLLTAGLTMILPLFYCLTLSTRRSTFLWGKAWYPIAVLDDLNPDIIHQATLLGKDFVFWRSTPSLTAWTITDNACSHRLAPLSEGMIIDT